MQTEANTAIKRLASGESKNIHETMLAVEKADIAFKTMNQIRGKIIDAYKEIIPAIMKQSKDEDYFLKKEIPQLQNV